MKLFAIVYLSGRIVASVGPWPETEIAFDQCERGRIMMETEAKKRPDADRWRFACEWRSEKPYIADAVDPREK